MSLIDDVKKGEYKSSVGVPLGRVDIPPDVADYLGDLRRRVFDLEAQSDKRGIGSTITRQIVTQTINSTTLQIPNAVLLYPSGEGSIGIFSPDEGGLGSALAGAANGDTVWLPSQVMSLTAGITIPLGVALVGLSENSVLYFNGFSGTAITLSANSKLGNFHLIFLADGATGIGVDARVYGAVVNIPTVYVQGPTTIAVGVWIGAAP